MAEKKKSRVTKAYSPKKFCPKCGSASRLADHANRRTCGKCGYTEMK